ncbi:pre-piRNA 3'-exonuclease trimmer isoform X2 [Augochlora pura]
MNEVLDNNFHQIYQDISIDLKNASFIAIDAEFTGIQSGDRLKYSLFDQINERYKILRESIVPFIMIQFGVAAFRYSEENMYKVKCYNFYLLPRSIPFKNRKFSLQVASLEFLSEHNFNFNKSMHNGISYIDQIDEELLKEYVKEYNLSNYIDHLSYHELDIFCNCRNKIKEWLLTAPHEISIEIKTVTPILQYIVHKELRNHFKNIWTISGHKSVIVIRVSEDMRKVYEEDNDSNVEKTVLDTYEGFSKVFKLLTSLKKPIVGHNILLDLMLMYQQFYKPLPKSYSEFKTIIHSLFPELYDTKHLSHEFTKKMEIEHKEYINWKTSSLSEVYEYFKYGAGRNLELYSTHIEIESISEDKKAYHTAGWDAYYAGNIFIKMGHQFAIQEHGRCIELHRLTGPKLMSSVKAFANSIYLAKKLDGNDPTHTRPGCLHVKLSSSSANMKEILDKFARFGALDVMPLDRKRILIAVRNNKSALDILHHFRNNKEIQVARYNPIKHVTPTRIAVWGTLIFTSGVFAWTTRRIFKESVIPD